MVLLRVPVALVVPLSILDVLVRALLVDLLVVVVFSAVLLVHLTEALSPVQVLARRAFLSVMLVPVEEVVVVSVVPHLLADVRVLLLSFITHAGLAVLPVVVGLLIGEVASRGVPKDQLVVACSLVWVA